MSQPISALVFDLDGTLAWTERYWLPVMAQVLEDTEREKGWKHVLGDVRETLQHLGKPSEEIMAEIYPQISAEEIAGVLAHKAKVWDGMLAEQPFELYPGTLETLAELKAAGWQLFVSSNCGAAYLKEMLESTGLGGHIQDAACLGGHPGLAKWEFTQKLLAKVDLKRGFFIGDSVHDMEAGRKNGLQTIFADYGYGRCDDPSLIDRHIGNIRELPDLLRQS